MEHEVKEMLEQPAPEETIDTSSEVEPNQQEVQEQPVKSDIAKNMRALREKAERAEKERDELARIAQQLLLQQKQPNPVAEEDDEDIVIAPDDIAEGKHLSRLGKKIKKLESQLKEYHQKSAEMALEARLKAQYPDFDNVVTKENLDALRMTDPEIASTIYSSSDLYAKAATAYKLIKKFGIGNADAYQNDYTRIKQNSTKPRAAASLDAQKGDSPLSHAHAFDNGLTPDLKKKLFEEMKAYSRRRI